MKRNNSATLYSRDMERRSSLARDLERKSSLARVPERVASTIDYHLDPAFSSELKSVCLHCAKLIEMMKMRHKTITFPSNESRAGLEGLKFTKKVHWCADDLEFLAVLYKTGEKRKKDIFEGLD